MLASSATGWAGHAWTSPNGHQAWLSPLWWGWGGLQKHSPFWWQLCFCSPNEWESGTSLPPGWGCLVPRCRAGHCRMQHGGCTAPSPWRASLLPARGHPPWGHPKPGPSPSSAVWSSSASQAFAWLRKCFLSFFPSSRFHRMFQSRSPSPSHPCIPAERCSLSLGDGGTHNPSRCNGRAAHCPARSEHSSPPCLPQHRQRIFPLFLPFQQAPSLLLKCTKTKTKEEGSNPLNPSPPPDSPLRTSTVRGDVPRSPPSQQGTDKPCHVLQRHLIHYKFHKARLGEALGQKSKQTRQE